MRYIRFLALGAACSAYGSYVNMVALSLFSYAVTGTALGTGLFMALRLSASVLGGSVAALLARRLDRKVLMMTADLTQATGLFTLLLAPDGARGYLLYGLAVVTGLCATVSSVSLRSAVPDIAGQELRVPANALLATSRSMAMVAGFASAGPVVAWLGFTGAIAIDACTFLVSAANLAVLPLRIRPTAGATGSDGGPDGDKAAGQGGAPERRTARWLFSLTPLLLFMVSIRGLDAFGSSSHNVGLPVYSSELDEAHPASFISFFWATWALGNIATQRVVAYRAKRSGRALGEWAFALGTVVMSATFVLGFAGLPMPLTVAIVFLAGMADGLSEIAYTSRLQTVPDDQRTRVFGISATVESVGFGSGMVISAALMERMSPFGVVGVMHGVALAVGVVFMFFLVRIGRAARERSAAQDGATSVEDRTLAEEGRGAR
ncbi:MULTISPECIES: MFS transporter [unclassified Streptomyces]|uniref:MFS transporter n=1 Tax=unclassified Streptomyces TaxID=2593676 RepID=UPI0033CE9B0D